MPIKSYLAHPYKGGKSHLMRELSAIKGCEVIPSENKNVLILITDTQTKKQEEFIKNQLHRIGSLQLLAMVSGFNTSSKD
jgi:nitrate reductase NapAB chaperone NapD